MLRIGIAPQNGPDAALPGLPGWLCRVLSARGADTPEKAERFLRPDMRQLLPPGLLHDMDKAVRLIAVARERGLRAAVYGDYDADGVCAAAILKEALGMYGVPADVYLPDRHAEGYGLNEAAVRELAREHGLLITVDCGITSLQETAVAKERGMAVIVTDHHRHLDALPEADAVITPLLGDYPFPHLCGAGVAFKLAVALLDGRALPLMDLAALATVADMVSLTGENRVLVRFGLERLAATRRPGLRALMNRAGVTGPIGSEQVAFQLAPRINACGRMESAYTALEMLLTKDPARAEETALKMEALNQERRRQENEVLEEALRQTEEMDLTATRAIVVMGEGWNSGVVGLAAGRIAEKYCYPAVALSREGDVCVGSARSAGDVDIHAALSACADLFDRFGGHRQAAGLTIRAEKVPEMARRLSEAVAAQTGGPPPIPQIFCDGEMTLADVTEETVSWLNRLEPFGVGNPAPRFLCDGAEVLSLTRVGAEGKHLKCSFRQGRDMRGGIFFGAGELWDRVDGACRMAMTPVINEFRGRVTAECRVYALEGIAESLEKDPLREALAYLDERLADGGAAEPIGLDVLGGLMEGTQGTLLVCRCLETALRMHSLFPEAEFSLGRADDPRAFHSVLLYGSAGRVSAAYRQVILCDGDLGESAAYRAACPRARVLRLETSPCAKRMLERMHVPMDEMRRCYVLLRQALPASLTDWRAQCGLQADQAAFALRVLQEIDLIELSLSPFRAEMRPMARRSPEESPLYRRSLQAREGR